VPNGAEHNPQLEAYTKATEAAAKEAGVGFVDLFHPSLDLYKAAREPLTINGVHMSAEGNRQLAEVIAKALLGKEVTASASLEELREAVMEKDVHWNARYRARDGNDVWGGRSTLAFTDGQTNAVVLQHELTMLDVMTGNRDPKVWARAKGGDLKVDDSNVPAPVPVISNVGGKSKSSSAMKEGRTEYISGQEAIKHMAFDPRFEVSLFADEAQFPQLVNPVQMQVDTKGRLWAAVWHTYPMWEPLKEMKDALVICHDDNKDGKADRITAFRIRSALSSGMAASSSPAPPTSSSSKTPMATTWPTCARSCCKASISPTRITARTISSWAPMAASTGRAASSWSTITSIRGVRRYRPARAPCIVSIRAASPSPSTPTTRRTRTASPSTPGVIFMPPTAPAVALTKSAPKATASKCMNC
jgi:hypothetical protein